MPIQISKDQLRKLKLEERDRLSEQTRLALSLKICEYLSREAQVRCVKLSRPLTIFSYYPFRSEVDVTGFLNECLHDGHTVVLPRALAGGEMTLHEVNDLSEMLPGRFGIKEPPPESKRFSEQGPFDMVLVPGAAFDRRGNRIGYGGGYYDRWMATYNGSNIKDHITPVKIAPIFHIQMVEHLPTEPHDQRVQALFTEFGPIDCCSDQ